MNNGKAEENIRRVACNKLIDENGILHGASVVTIDTHTHKLVSIQPLQNEEYPFTEWIGGTIVLLHKKSILPQYATLRQYIEFLSELSRSNNLKPSQSAEQEEDTHQQEVWHTLFAELDTPLPHPLFKL